MNLLIGLSEGFKCQFSRARFVIFKLPSAAKIQIIEQVCNDCKPVPRGGNSFIFSNILH